ncbi:MAG: FecR family protein, partial [Verrucomicrobiota bacterium]
MTRVEELTFREIEGQLCEKESKELDELLESDPENRQRHRQLLDVEVHLRNLDEHLDVSDAVMASILPKRNYGEADWKPDGDSLRDRFVFRFLLPVGAAAVVLSAMVALVLVPANPSTVVDLGGQFELVRRGVVQDPGGMQRLVAGDLIVALEEAAAELKFEDDTQIRLAPGAEVIFEPKLTLDEPVSRGLDLLRGSLEATVSPQPGAQRFVVNTPHAAAVVRGTRFTLEVGKRQTRLQVQEGRVDLIHHPSGKVTKVVAGKSAIARPASSSLRSRKGLLAYYTFQTGAGEMVKDRSDFQSPLPLYLTGPDKKTVSWLGYQGMSFPQQARLQSAPGKKIVRACRSSGELGIEVWMKPGRSFQGGPAPIISMAQG